MSCPFFISVVCSAFEFLFYYEYLLFFDTLPALKAEPDDIGHEVDDTHEIIGSEAAVIIVEYGAESCSVSSHHYVLVFMSVKYIIESRNVPVHYRAQALAVALAEIKVSPAPAEHLGIIAVFAAYTLVEPVVDINIQSVLSSGLLYGIIAALIRT